MGHTINCKTCSGFWESSHVNRKHFGHLSWRHELNWNISVHSESYRTSVCPLSALIQNTRDLYSPDVFLDHLCATEQNNESSKCLFTAGRAIATNGVLRNRNRSCFSRWMITKETAFDEASSHRSSPYSTSWKETSRPLTSTRQM